MDDQSLAVVVDRMYEAAAQPQLWKEVLGELAVATDSLGAQMLYHRPAGAALHTASAGLEDIVQAFFREGWHVQNPREMRARKRGFPLHQVICDSDIFTPEELDAEPWQRDFLDRYGLRWFASFNAMPFDEIAPVVLTIERPAAREPFSPQEVAQLTAVVPHVQRASRLAFAVGAAAGAGLLEGLDRVDRGAVLFDDLGRIVAINGTAERQLPEVVSIRQGRLHGLSGAVDAELQALIASITAQEPFYGRAAPCAMTAPRPGKRPLLIQGTPLVQSAREFFHFAVGLVILSDLEDRRVPDAVLLREAFSLTPAEVRIAQALADGQRPPAIAQSLQVTYETVRSQLKSIFLKTGANTQGDLVVMLDRMAGA